MSVPRRLLACVSLTLVGGVLGVPGVAAADDARTGETVVGELVQVWPEHEDRAEAVARADDGPLSFVRTDDGDAVRVDTDDVDHLPLGATVRLTIGAPVADAASAQDGYEPAHDVLRTQVLDPTPDTPQPAPSTSPATPPYTDSVTVAMVVPAGGTRDSAQLSDVVDLVDGDVAGFWSEQTDGAVSIGVTASYDWISTTAGCSDPYALWNEVASDVGFVRGAGKHLLLYVSSAPANLAGCSYGLAEVGSSRTSGGYAYVRDTKTSVIAHELGHNLGLGHSSERQCDRSVDAGSCRTTAYRDYYDVMGASWDEVGSLNAAQERLLGVLPDARVQTFTTSTAPATVTVQPVSQRSGTRALQLISLGTRYWLEYRPAVGRDSYLAGGANQLGLRPGVQLRMSSTSSDTSLLLDGTPSAASAWDSDSLVSLPVGAAVSIAGGDFVLTVTGQDASGATVQVTPSTAISRAYAASGGPGGPLGSPVTAESCSGPPWACERRFQNGAIYWDATRGTRTVQGAIYTRWAASSWQNGPLGLPLGDATCGLAAGGCAQQFAGGWLYWSPDTGAIAMQGAIRTGFLAAGGLDGPLGYPTADETTVAGGRTQTFTGGAVYWSSATGAHSLQGGIRTAYDAGGGPAGPLGFPISDWAPVTGGSAAAFQNGSCYESAATGAHVVRGAVRGAWWGTGGISGPLGFPTGEETAVGSGTRQTFTGGTVYASPATGAHVARSAAATAYGAAGGPTGPLGFPVSDYAAVTGGYAMAFQDGSLYESAGTGAHVVRGAGRLVWWTTGGISGPLGYPTTDTTAVAGGFATDFQGGSVYESPTTGAHVVKGDIRTAWLAAGGVSGPLGFPVSDPLSVPGGSAQAFSGGSVYSSPATGAHAVPAAFLLPWWATGGVTGPYGFPATDLLTVPGGTAIAFQGGSVYSSPSTGAHAVAGALRGAWWNDGGVSGPLGFPVSDLLAVPGGTAQAFSGGSVYASPATGAHVVRSAFLLPWWTTGGVTGPLGFPVSDVLTVPGGTAIAFAGGSLYSSPSTGTHAVSGALRGAWWNSGGVSGPLGFPVSDLLAVPGGTAQAFSGGSVYASPASGAHVVRSAFLLPWWATGGVTGPLGFPATDLLVVPGGAAQAFTGGSVYAKDTQPAFAVYGASRNAWWSGGGVTGVLGFPTANTTAVGSGTATRYEGGLLYSGPQGTFRVNGDLLTAVDRVGGLAVLGAPISSELLVTGGTAQAFERGSVYWSSASGAHVISGPVRSAWWATGGVTGPYGFPTGDVTSDPSGQSVTFSSGTLHWSAPSGAWFVAG